MARVNSYGYVERRQGKVSNGKHRFKTFINWFFVKHQNERSGYSYIGRLYFPQKYLGKKIRLKVEIKEK